MDATTGGGARVGRGRMPAPSRAPLGWVVIAIAAAFVLPLWIMLSGSLRPLGLPPPTSVEVVPPSPSFANYVDVFQVVPLGRSTLNSVVVAAVAVPLGGVVASWAGYAAVRLPRRQGLVLVVVAGVAALLPIVSLLVGRVAIWRTLGLADTLVPLMAAGLVGVTPVGVLAFAWAFHRLPRELYDLADEVGLSPISTWARVAMPLSRPVTAAVAALAFVSTWGSFAEPLVVLADERWFTLPLSLRALTALDAPFRPLMLAGAVVATAPVVIAFAVLHRGLLRELRRGPAA